MGDKPEVKERFIKTKIQQYAIPKINMLHNLSCIETRFRLLCVDSLLHRSLNLAFRQRKLHNNFIFGVAYSKKSSKKETQVKFVILLDGLYICLFQFSY